jgi:pyrimidine deaminase RibD-like protein
MERAIAQARQSGSAPGKVSPKVGARVVVRDGVLLGEAFRRELAPETTAEPSIAAAHIGI